MDELFSIANLVAVIGAIAVGIKGLMIYRAQKEADVEFEKGELKRTSISDYLGSIDALVNHAAFFDGKSASSEATLRIINCKAQLNRVYMYAPQNVANAMDELLTDASELASVISKIPNTEIFKDEHMASYQEPSNKINISFTKAVNIAREEVGLHHENINQVQVLLLGNPHLL